MTTTSQIADRWRHLVRQKRYRGFLDIDETRALDEIWAQEFSRRVNEMRKRPFRKFAAALAGLFR